MQRSLSKVLLSVDVEVLLQKLFHVLSMAVVGGQVQSRAPENVPVVPLGSLQGIRSLLRLLELLPSSLDHNRIVGVDLNLHVHRRLHLLLFSLILLDGLVINQLLLWRRGQQGASQAKADQGRQPRQDVGSEDSESQSPTLRLRARPESLAQLAPKPLHIRAEQLHALRRGIRRGRRQLRRCGALTGALTVAFRQQVFLGELGQRQILFDADPANHLDTALEEDLAFGLLRLRRSQQGDEEHQDQLTSVHGD
mmetsp:Transcript_9389/g.22155  ORF Transcript_9389/g.22155 Transcript_9389/m.22155 type:complete len:252 (-) Transcript_9389:60-815(-)